MKKIFGILLSVIGSIIAISGLILKIAGQASASIIDEVNGSECNGNTVHSRAVGFPGVL